MKKGRARMSTDVALVAGLFLVILAIPAMFSAWVDGRTPRLPMVLIVVAGGLVAYALTQKPGGYTVGEVPDVVYRVVGEALR